MDQVCNTIQIQDMIIFHRGFNCRIQTVDRFFTIRIPAYHMRSYPLFNILRLSASGVLFAGALHSVLITRRTFITSGRYFTASEALLLSYVIFSV